MPKRTNVYPKRTYDKDESKDKRLQRKYDEAKKEIKRLRNIIKRIHPEKLRDAMEGRVDQRDPETKTFKVDNNNEKRCEKCNSTNIKSVTVNRLDGPHEITFCLNEDCKHRSSMRRVTNTDSKNNQDENDDEKTEL